MRKPAVTFDAILAAVAVLSAGASACSKADRATAEPAAASPAAPDPAPSVKATAAAPPAAPPPPAVDAGTEVKQRAKGSPAKNGGHAACGATGCSADMRKGGK